ncbi:hypothetical protein [Geomicrobium sp. JCM 19039]|uniref:hypothetical protein n=1 Tax=Geomicrobium sp. JCM 19039 TaxID=1460636 RepID=UPI00045F3002|nr:hypothetical protein [Geomicrobium sp. JCM 19039]GAK12657.1 hypothetical protein JCM19039_2449 [Geomicrobium sp. JCM 19039]
MFGPLFIFELQNRIGTPIQIATDNSLIEGTLVNVNFSLVVIDADDGYSITRQFINANEINFFRDVDAVI